MDFKNDSIKIPRDEIYPILSYLKIDFHDNYCIITKNGLKAFIKKGVSSESTEKDGIMLVSEDKLFSIAENSTSDMLELTQVEDKIKIVSGRSKATTATDDLSKFPTNDEPTQLWQDIYIEALTALASGINFIVDEVPEKTQPQMANIYCKEKTIVGCNGAIAFYKPLHDDIPEMILRKEVAMAISTLPGCKFSQNSSYNFFKSESSMFAFSKSESPFFDLRQFGKIETDKPSFTINKDDLIRFNNTCINTSKSKLVTSKFNCLSPTVLQLIYEDPDSGLDELVASVDIKDGYGEFKYKPEVMNQLLKSIPSTMCVFYPGKNKYYITDESKSFVTLIMGSI